MGNLLSRRKKSVGEKTSELKIVEAIVVEQKTNLKESRKDRSTGLNIKKKPWRDEEIDDFSTWSAFFGHNDVIMRTVKQSKEVESPLAQTDSEESCLKTFNIDEEADGQLQLKNEVKILKEKQEPIESISIPEDIAEANKLINELDEVDARLDNDKKDKTISTEPRQLKSKRTAILDERSDKISSIEIPEEVDTTDDIENANRLIDELDEIMGKKQRKDPEQRTISKKGFASTPSRTLHFLENDDEERESLVLKDLEDINLHRRIPRPKTRRGPLARGVKNVESKKTHWNDSQDLRIRYTCYNPEECPVDPGAYVFKNCFSSISIYLLKIPEDTREQHPIMRLVAGALAGIVSATATYPLDLIRTRLACQGEGAERKYRNIRHAFVTILREEGGLFSNCLFKGIGPTLIGIAPYIGLNFMVYESLKGFCLTYYLAETAGHKLRVLHHDKDLPVTAKLCCGAVAGAVAQSGTYPLDVVRRRMQMEGAAQGLFKYNSTWDAFKVIIRTEGFVGLYKGMWPNLLKVAPTIGIQFAIYELSKSFLMSRIED